MTCGDITFTEENLKNFWKKVEVKGEDECWLWLGCKSHKGYGRFHIRSVRHRGAHQYSHLINIGPIPAGHDVRHLCHNKLCVNPKHLDHGTRQENENDKVAAGRQAKQKGEDSGRHKVTESQVLEMRRLYGLGARNRRLSELFKLSSSQVSKICNRQNWTHI
jgi:hypothetical protein